MFGGDEDARVVDRRPVIGEVRASFAGRLRLAESHLPKVRLGVATGPDLASRKLTSAKAVRGGKQPDRNDAAAANRDVGIQRMAGVG